jgi:outer membrane biogenesis lipoprotein LolB
MKFVLFAFSFSAVAAVGGSGFAAETYNSVSTDDPQFKQCKVISMSQYNGGGESSPIAEQSKAEAYCTCMWNETPENFKGNLIKFGETEKGIATDKVCEKYSNWGN